MNNKFFVYALLTLLTLIIYTKIKSYLDVPLNEFIQKYPSPKHYDIPVDSSLEKVLKEFNDDCNTYGIDPSRIMFLDSIIVVNDNDKIFGEVDIKIKNDTLHGVVRIQKKAFHDSLSIRWIVYHELAHWYGLEHSNGIMEDGYTIEVITIIEPGDWDLLVWDLFNKIRVNNKLLKTKYKDA